MLVLDVEEVEVADEVEDGVSPDAVNVIGVAVDEAADTSVPSWIKTPLRNSQQFAES